jgi:hypothetical protein
VEPTTRTEWLKSLRTLYAEPLKFGKTRDERNLACTIMALLDDIARLENSGRDDHD